MNEQDDLLLQMVNENRQLLGLPPQTKADAGFSCPNCAALESVEAARRDAQESRFALIVENEELGAELAATRARLESVEAALKRIEAYPVKICPMIDAQTQCIHAGQCEAIAGMWGIAHAALGAAGERSE